MRVSVYKCPDRQIMPGRREWISQTRIRRVCSWCVRPMNNPEIPMVIDKFRSGSNENMASRSIINVSYGWWESFTFVRLLEKGTPIGKSKIDMEGSTHTPIWCVRITRPDAQMKNGAQTSPTFTPDRVLSTWPSSRKFLMELSWDMLCYAISLFTWSWEPFKQQLQACDRSREWSFKVTRDHNFNLLLTMHWPLNLGSFLLCHVQGTVWITPQQKTSFLIWRKSYWDIFAFKISRKLCDLWKTTFTSTTMVAFNWKQNWRRSSSDVSLYNSLWDAFYFRVHLLGCTPKNAFFANL